VWRVCECLYQERSRISMPALFPCPPLSLRPSIPPSLSVPPSPSPSLPPLLSLLLSPLPSLPSLFSLLSLSLSPRFQLRSTMESRKSTRALRSSTRALLLLQVPQKSPDTSKRALVPGTEPRCQQNSPDTSKRALIPAKERASWAMLMRRCCRRRDYCRGARSAEDGECRAGVSGVGCRVEELAAK